PTSLRRSDIGTAKRALLKAKEAFLKAPSPVACGLQLQVGFGDFFEQVKVASGTEGWLEWADQYRNMFVHGGRRIISNRLTRKQDANITLNGIFKSCRNLEENVCERLLTIWRERRNNPALIEQPDVQWDSKIKPCNFIGYNPNSPKLNSDSLRGNPILLHRML